MKVILDWEAKNYKWLPLSEVKKLKLLSGFDDVLKRLSLMDRRITKKR